MSGSIPQPASIHELDVLLAERAIEGGLHGQRLLFEREARDRCWIVGALGCRGVNVTADDVFTAVHGTAGRFLPGQPEFELIRGLRRAIDEIERRAERGEPPDGERVLAIHELVTARQPELPASLRDGAPWEAVPGLDHPTPDELPGLLARFTEREGYLEDRAALDAMHPVARGAVVFRGLARLSPFRDFNLTTSALAAAWYLMARGYPPFLPQGTDRATMKEVLTGPPTELLEWFAQVVLVGFRTVLEG